MNPALSYQRPALNKLSVSVFWDISVERETSRVGLQDLMPSCRTQTPLQHLRPLKEERSLLLQRGQAVLTPVGLLSEL